MVRVVLLFFGICVSIFGQTALRSLKGVPVPEPTGLSTYVRDKQALIALGKAFFWDIAGR